MDQDTISLLGDCTAGIDMAISTMDGVLPSVKDQTLRRKIQESVKSHQNLREQTVEMLHRCGAQEKPSNPMAKGMSWLKTNTKLAFGGDDTTVAYLVADGCDMGVKSLSRYLNQYAAADEKSKDIAKRLIALEADLSKDLRGFL